VRPPPGGSERRHGEARDDLLLDTSVRRFRDTRFDAIAVRVFPGEHYVTRNREEMLVTILGSCVAACIRDPVAGIGGMNHFMLPEGRDDSGRWGAATAPMRYGNFAMERLINDILNRGGHRNRLEIKVFGGARVLNIGSNVGEQNADFVESYLRAEGLPIAARHLFGNYPRRIHYFPLTGQVFMQELRREDDIALIANEVKYRAQLKVQQVDGSIELFD
jgi:chemotaxis protein CheD